MLRTLLLLFMTIRSMLLKTESQPAILLFLIIFFCFGIAIAYLTPYGEFPDERSHLQYVRYIDQHHELPKLSYNLSEIPSTVAFHPPLYYIVAAILIQQSSAPEMQMLILRIFSVFQGLAAVFILWKCANLVFPGNRAAAVLTMAVTVFNPQFIFIHSGAGNIPMTTLTCAFVALCLIKIMTRPTNLMRSSVLLGIALGLALLSRTVTVYIVPPSLIVLFLKAKDRKQSFYLAATLTICTTIVAGWWYIGNWIQYGDPILWKVGSATVGAYAIKQGDVFEWMFLFELLAFLHASFWAYFGRNEYHGEIWQYAIYLFLELSAVLGIYEIWRKNGHDADFQSPAFERPAFFIMLLAGSIAILELLITLMKIRSGQGRYLYMTIVPLALGLGAGLVKILPQAWRMRGAIIGSVFLFMFQIYLLIRYWLPHV